MKSAGVEAPLDKYQNKGLRNVAGAFRTIPTKALEIETFIPSLNIYLDSRVAAFRTRLAESGLEKKIQAKNEKFKDRFRKRRNAKHQPARSTRKDE